MTTSQKLCNLIKRQNMVSNLKTRQINRDPSTMKAIGYRVKWLRDLGEEKVKEMTKRDIAWATKVVDDLNKDERYLLARQRLEKLTNQELQRIVNNVDRICWDTYNFDAENNKFCPIAIAMNLHKTVSNPTDKLINAKISERFNPPNILKGIPGEWYTNNRRSDLISLCRLIISLRAC